MMANNYQYIVAGLPDLLLDFGHKSFDIARIKTSIREQLSPKDQRWIDWLDFGLNPARLGPHFYRMAAKTKNAFIREYFAFDWQMRTVLAAVSGRKEVHLLRNQSDIAPRLLTILETENILEREQKLDRLRWDKANELCTFHYFDVDVVLCFLLKISIIERWMRLDKVRGRELFGEMVREIKANKIVR